VPFENGRFHLAGLRRPLVDAIVRPKSLAQGEDLAESREGEKRGHHRLSRPGVLSLTCISEAGTGDSFPVFRRLAQQIQRQPLKLPEAFVERD
jgi:hypothetical protein